MNDQFESSLRASLKAVSVTHDDVHADRMIAVATAGDLLPDRRHLLAPLTAAAAVVAVGATVAVVAQHGSDPAPSGNPVGAPTTSSRAALPDKLYVTVENSAVAAPNGKTVHHTYGVVYDPKDSDTLPKSPFWVTLKNLTVDKVTIVNSRGDRAGFQLVSGRKVLVNTSVSGKGRTSVTIPSTRVRGLTPVVQCREPGRGTSCRLTVEYHGVLYHPFGTKSPPTVSDPPYIPTPRKAPSTTASSGSAPGTTDSSRTAPSSGSGPVYEPPTRPSDAPSCSGCQIP